MEIRVEDATRRFVFEITKEDVKNAVPRNPERCVIRQAIHHTLPMITEIWVGASVTVLTVRETKTDEFVKYRYGTPHILNVALNQFDQTGDWGLPPGIYYLGKIEPARRLQVRNTADQW